LEEVDQDVAIQGWPSPRPLLTQGSDGCATIATRGPGAEGGVTRPRPLFGQHGVKRTPHRLGAGNVLPLAKFDQRGQLMVRNIDDRAHDADT